MSKKWTIYADRVKKLLKEHDMSQKDLAEKVGCTESTMSRYISAQRVPKANTILKTAEVFNVSCDYLVGIDIPEDNISTMTVLYEVTDECVDRIADAVVRKLGETEK